MSDLTISAENWNGNSDTVAMGDYVGELPFGMDDFVYSVMSGIITPMLDLIDPSIVSSPTSEPTSSSPTSEPTSKPTDVPFPMPTVVPGDPSKHPIPAPTSMPSTQPTPAPSSEPTAMPSPIPTPAPVAGVLVTMTGDWHKVSEESGKQTSSFDVSLTVTLIQHNDDSTPHSHTRAHTNIAHSRASPNMRSLPPRTYTTTNRYHPRPSHSVPCT